MQSMRGNSFGMGYDYWSAKDEGNIAKSHIRK
jgi:hypothetical protein